MNDEVEVDDAIRDLLARIVAASPEPPPLTSKPVHSEHRPPRRGRWLAAAAAVIVVGIGVALFVSRSDETHVVDSVPPRPETTTTMSPGSSVPDGVLPDYTGGLVTFSDTTIWLGGGVHRDGDSWRPVEEVSGYDASGRRVETRTVAPPEGSYWSGLQVAPSGRLAVAIECGFPTTPAPPESYGICADAPLWVIDLDAETARPVTTEGGNEMTVSGPSFSVIGDSTTALRVALREGAGVLGTYPVGVYEVAATGVATRRGSSTNSNVQWWCWPGTGDLTEAQVRLVDGRPADATLVKVDGSTVEPVGDPVAVPSTATEGRLDCNAAGDRYLIAIGTDVSVQTLPARDGRWVIHTLPPLMSPRLDASFVDPTGALVLGLKSGSFDEITVAVAQPDGTVSTVASEKVEQPSRGVLPLLSESDGWVNMIEAFQQGPEATSIEPQPIR